MADAPDTIMNLDDLAAYVKLSKSSLYKLCQAGKVPGTKIGRAWRFHKDVIDTWIKTGAPPTQAYGTARAKTKKSRKEVAHGKEEDNHPCQPQLHGRAPGCRGARRSLGLRETA